jgi:hypothetical protein
MTDFNFPPCLKAKNLLQYLYNFNKKLGYFYINNQGNNNVNMLLGLTRTGITVQYNAASIVVS